LRCYSTIRKNLSKKLKRREGPDGDGEGQYCEEASSPLRGPTREFWIGVELFWGEGRRRIKEVDEEILRGEENWASTPKFAEINQKSDPFRARVPGKNTGPGMAE